MWGVWEPSSAPFRQAGVDQDDIVEASQAPDEEEARVAIHKAACFKDFSTAVVGVVNSPSLQRVRSFLANMFCLAVKASRNSGLRRADFCQ